MKTVQKHFKKLTKMVGLGWPDIGGSSSVVALVVGANRFLSEAGMINPEEVAAWVNWLE